MFKKQTDDSLDLKVTLPIKLLFKRKIDRFEIIKNKIKKVIYT